MRNEPKLFEGLARPPASYSSAQSRQLHQQLLRLVSLSDLPGVEGQLDAIRSQLSAYEHMAQAASTVFVIVDVPSAGYLYMSEHFVARTFLDTAMLRAHGLSAWMERLHPDDARGLASVHQAIYDLLPEIAAEQRAHVKFNYNYRLQDARGEFRHFLQQSVALQYSPEGFPVVLLTFVSEIGHLRQHPSLMATLSLSPRERKVWCYHQDRLELMDQPLLSGRELEIMDLVSSYNLSSPQVAERLNIKATTVAFYRKRLLARTGCVSLHALAGYARLAGWR